MNDFCGRFHFAKDMNGDLMFTISDIWLMIKFIWLLPAKAIMALIDNSPQLVTFFEATCAMGDSWGGGVLSFFGWLVILILGIVLDAAAGGTY